MVQLKILLKSGDKILSPARESVEQFAPVLELLDQWLEIRIEKMPGGQDVLTIGDGIYVCRVWFNQIVGYQFIEPERRTEDILTEHLQRAEGICNPPKESWQE